MPTGIQDFYLCHLCRVETSFLTDRPAFLPLCGAGPPVCQLLLYHQTTTWYTGLLPSPESSGFVYPTGLISVCNALTVSGCHVMVEHLACVEEVE